jgi:uncharacterized protein YbaR (Trm112 family)
VKERILDLLRCPSCGLGLSLKDEVVDQGEIREGQIECDGCNATYPIRNFIPRFVDDDNYARGFGFQWNRHARTLVDKFNGTSITAERFYAGTQWDKEDIGDAHSGSGLWCRAIHTDHVGCRNGCVFTGL